MRTETEIRNKLRQLSDPYVMISMDNKDLMEGQAVVAVLRWVLEEK